MLTDDQRARCAVMCGWTYEAHLPRWLSQDGTQSTHGMAPPIETMPEEWAKLMERAMKAGWEFGYNDAAGYYAEGKHAYHAHDDHYADSIGECVCLAALAMEDK